MRSEDEKTQAGQILWLKLDLAQAEETIHRLIREKGEQARIAEQLRMQMEDLGVGLTLLGIKVDDAVAASRNYETR